MRRWCAALSALLLAQVGPTHAQSIRFQPASKPAAREISAADLRGLRTADTYKPEVFLGVRNIPRADDAAVIGWIQSNSGNLSPAYLYELANRLWRRDEQQAFEWFALAALRARYDAFRCVDRSAAQGIAFLPEIAADVGKAAQIRRAEFGEAGLRAMARADLFSDGVSPMWICLHGMRAINEAIQGRSVSEADLVKPSSDWQEIRERLRTQYVRYFEEQGKPQDDPFPLVANPPQYTELGQRVGRGEDFAWADATTLVFFSAEQGADGKPTRQLHYWSPASGLRNGDVVAGFGGLCAGSGRVMIRTKIERRDGQPVLIYEDGTPVARTIKEIAGAPLPQWPIAALSGATSWGVDKSAFTLDRFGCRWVDNLKVTAQLPGRQWLPLAEGHGFLHWSASGMLEWLSDEQSAPLTVPVDASQVPFQGVQYIRTKEAYFISPIWRGREKELKADCAASAWLHPRSRRVERTCAPNDALSSSVMTFSPAPEGIVRIVHQRQTFHGPKTGGLYLTYADGRTTKIFESRINASHISPDGCRLAFTHAPETARASFIGVVDLCARVAPG